MDYRLLVLLITVISSAFVPPSWTINTNIDAGEVKAVNSAVSNTLLPGTVNRQQLQTYNKTGFTIAPRVILSMIGYSHIAPNSASDQIGFKIVVLAPTLTNFLYNITAYSVAIVDLRYLYFAVSYETDAYYFQMNSLTFNASSNLVITTSTQRWEIYTMTNPQGWSNSNYTNADAQVLAFPTGFQLRPHSGRSYVSINATILNMTHYTLNISTIANNSLSMVDFSVIMFNRVTIQANYTVYEDIMISNVIGNTSYLIPPVISSDQYMFRNCLTGAVHIQFTILGVPVVGYYYSGSTANNTFFVWRTFNNRVRQCPANTSYYEPIATYCYDVCPTSFFTDMTYKLCLPCHYSCNICTQPNDILGCSVCDSAQHRTLINNTCVCDPGYYESNILLCGTCNYRCLTCTDGNENSCLSCSSLLNRNIMNTSCICATGYYENNTCLTCSSNSRGCLTCNYLFNSSIFSCISCDSSLNRQLSNSTCSCIIGYYENITCLRCSSNSLGCLTCNYLQITSIFTCLTCDLSLNRQLLNNTCICSNGYYESTNNTCTKCPEGCLSCLFDGTKVICSNCNVTLNLFLSNNSCPCVSQYYQDANNTCVRCSSGCLSCMLVNSVVICSNCNGSLSKILSNGNLSCICAGGTYQDSAGACLVCPANCITCLLNNISLVQCTSCNSSYILDNTSCIANVTNSNSSNSTINTTNSTCGNGILQSSQICDDGNAINLDGCSSTCQVQANCQCIQNRTLYNYSLCYYRAPIQFTTKLVYKIPGQNSVKLQFYINAPDCNENYLKSYLQKAGFIRLYDRARLLIESSRILQGATWINIVAKSLSYDAPANILTINFDYNADIDLTSKYIQFSPSNDVSQKENSYFYASPVSSVSLQQPYNNLMTKYQSQGDLNSAKNSQYVFIILVICYWIFLLITLARKRGVTGVQCMLVMMFTYFTLIDQSIVAEGWLGLQLGGKYLLGYNVIIIEEHYVKDLKILELDSNLLNILNITLIVIVLMFLAFIAYFIYEYRAERRRFKKMMQINDTEGNRSQKNDSKSYPEQQKQIGKLQIIFSYILDIIISFLFLSIGIIMIAITFTQTITIMGNLIIATLQIVISVIIWIIYYRRKQITFSCKDISYSLILINSQKTAFDNIVKIVIQKYYLIMYILVAIICLIIALARNIGVAVYAIIIVGNIGFIFFHFKIGIFFQRSDSYRSIINSVSIVILMLLHLISSLLSSSLGVGIGVVGASYSILFLNIAINIFLFVLVERKKIFRNKGIEMHKEQMKKMDNQIAMANLSFLGVDKLNNSADKSRDYTKDKQFFNPAQYSSARHHLLRQDEQAKIYNLIQQKIKELKDFKKNIQSQLVDPSLPFQSQQASEINNISLENVLGQLNLSNIEEQAAQELNGL